MPSPPAPPGSLIRVRAEAREDDTSFRRALLLRPASTPSRSAACGETESHQVAYCAPPPKRLRLEENLRIPSASPPAPPHHHSNPRVACRALSGKGPQVARKGGPALHGSRSSSESQNREPCAQKSSTCNADKSLLTANDGLNSSSNKTLIKHCTCSDFQSSCQPDSPGSRAPPNRESSFGRSRRSRVGS